MTENGLDNLLFGTYVVAAIVSILNVVIPRLTVRGMGRGNPSLAEDPAKASVDPTPTPAPQGTRPRRHSKERPHRPQAAPNEGLEPNRREWWEDPPDRNLMLSFLVAGLLFVVLVPMPIWLEECVLLAYLAMEALGVFASLRVQTPSSVKLASRVLSMLSLIPILIWALGAVIDAIDDLTS